MESQNSEGIEKHTKMSEKVNKNDGSRRIEEREKTKKRRARSLTKAILKSGSHQFMTSTEPFPWRIASHWPRTDMRRDITNSKSK